MPSFFPAHWMTKEELTHDFHAGLDTSSATQIGTYHAMPLYLTPERLNRGVLIVESQGVVTPQRGSHLLSWFFLQQPTPPASLVVLDPQQQFKQLFAGMLGKTHTLFEVSFYNPGSSLKYNPLMHVPLVDETMPQAKEYTTRRQEESASVFARILSMPFSTPDPRYPALPELLSQTLLACILHLRATEPFAPFSRLRDLTRSKEKLFDALAHSPSQRVHHIFEAYLAPLDDNAIMQAFLPALSAAACQPLYDPNWEQLTAHNDIDFTCLTREPIVLFFTPYRDVGSNNARMIHTLFLTQLLLTTLYAYEDHERTQKQDRRDESGSDMLPIRLILENVLAYCDLQVLEALIEPLQRHGMSLIVTGPSSVWSVRGDDEAAQHLSQLCATHLVLNAASLSDCEHYSALCGPTDKTVQMLTQDGIQVTHEPLIWPHSIHTLYPGHALLVRNDGAPAIIELHDALDPASSAHIHALRQPYTINQSPCFDNETRDAVVGPKREHAMRRAMMSYRDTSSPSPSSAERTYFQEVEESMRSIRHEWES